MATSSSGSTTANPVGVGVGGDGVGSFGHHLCVHSLTAAGEVTGVHPPSDRPRPANIDTNQLQFLNKIIKSVFALKMAAPLRYPVDPVALQIPDYPLIILRPMDLNTVKNRLMKKYYYNAHECLCDINQLFSNCYVYNRPGELVVAMAMEVEKIVRNKLLCMPQPELPHIGGGGGNKKRSSRAPPNASHNHHHHPQHPNNNSSSNSSSSGKKLTSEFFMTTQLAGPPPPPLQQSADNVVSATTPVMAECQQRNALLTECLAVLRQLQSRRLQSLSGPFLQPVDAVRLGLLDYHDVVKQPMDMGTMAQKLLQCHYTNHKQFHADFQLMIDNCIRYNGEDSVIGKKANALLNVYEDLYNRFVLNPTTTTTTTTTAPLVITAVPPPPPPTSSSLGGLKLQSSSSITPAAAAALSISSPSSTCHISTPTRGTTTTPYADINKNRVLSDEEEEELEALFDDCKLVAQKATRLASLLENVRCRVQRLCDKRRTSFAGLQKFLHTRGFDHLPDFFVQPSTEFIGVFADQATLSSNTRHQRARKRPFMDLGGDSVKPPLNNGKASKLHDVIASSRQRRDTFTHNVSSPSANLRKRASSPDSNPSLSEMF